MLSLVMHLCLGFHLVMDLLVNGTNMFLSVNMQDEAGAAKLAKRISLYLTAQRQVIKFTCLVMV